MAVSTAGAQQAPQQLPQQPPASAEATRLVEQLGPATLLDPAARRYLERIVADLSRVNPGKEAAIRAAMFGDPIRLLTGAPYYATMAPFLARELDSSLDAETLRRAAAAPDGWRRPESQPAAVSQAADRVVALMFTSREGQAAITSGLRHLQGPDFRFPTPGR